MSFNSRLKLILTFSTQTFLLTGLIVLFGCCTASGYDEITGKNGEGDTGNVVDFREEIHQHSSIHLAQIDDVYDSTMGDYKSESPADTVVFEQSADPNLVIVSHEQPSIRIQSPFSSRKQTLKLHNAIAVEVLLNFGYTEKNADQGDWKTAEMTGLTDQRFFEKIKPGTSTLTFELSIAVNPATGYDLIVYGRSTVSGDNSHNSELNTLAKTAEKLIASLPESNGQSAYNDIGYQIYKLSYINTNRALGILEAMGYEYIESRAERGQSAIDPSKQNVTKLPYIIELLDPAKTSLMDPSPNGASVNSGYSGGGLGISSIPDIGGTYLHQTTSGEPVQRLLIAYDRNNIEDFEKLIRLIQEMIDVPARQVVIEALVVELNTDRFRELGLQFSGDQDRFTYKFEKQADAITPFVMTFDDTIPRIEGTFKGTLEALIDNGEAELLSSPSVLVLDGRQARIQVAEQQPVTKNVSTAAASFGSVEYIPIGIVLNLRPRISRNGRDVTMQTEIIVSSTLEVLEISKGANAINAPVIDSRKVQTFVRVMDNQPFIIGGLIKRRDVNERKGLPILGELPYIGRLFRKTTTSREKKEVIVVLTPHVMPLDEGNFTYTIPKDHDIFDAFDRDLFRNQYRIKRSDVFDMNFLHNADSLKKLIATIQRYAAADAGVAIDPEFSRILNGGVPGEAILIRRMLYEIIYKKLKYYENIRTDNIIFFEPRNDSPMIEARFLSDYLAKIDNKDNCLALVFDTQSAENTERTLHPPMPTIQYENLSSESEYRQRLTELNSKRTGETHKQSAIILSEALENINRLKSVLILKRLLKVNQTLPMTIKGFEAGSYLAFPEKQVLQKRNHVIDIDIARYFYEVYHYYGAFQYEFIQQSETLLARLEKTTKK